jgi:transposase
MRDLEARMGNALEPFREDLENLTTIPGISDVAAHVITGEIGLDMSRFTVGNAISWASLCPRLDESAGKHRSRRIRKGAPWLKTTLVSAAWAAVKTKGSYLQAQFQRRRGAKKAIIAVAASMLTAATSSVTRCRTRISAPTTSLVATRSTSCVACSAVSKTSDSL